MCSTRGFRVKQVLGVCEHEQQQSPNRRATHNHTNKQTNNTNTQTNPTGGTHHSPGLHHRGSGDPGADVRAAAGADAIDRCGGDLSI